jgi:sugar phosphate isomerase/epimerase
MTRMTALLMGLEELGRRTNLKFAVEDFPLDNLAIDYYSRDLRPLLDCSRYGILVDIGHMNLRRTGEAYFRAFTVGQYIERIPRPIFEVHVHDNNGRQDEHKPLGEGNIDFAAIAAALKAIGFDGVSTIETAPSLHGRTPADDLPTVQPSLEQWRGYWG